jgi:hypothetical protein
MVLFGAGCPTTIFLNGLLISSLSRITNKWVLGIVFTYSAFVGGNWAWGGIAVDWLFFWFRNNWLGNVDKILGS